MSARRLSLHIRNSTKCRAAQHAMQSPWMSSLKTLRPTTEKIATAAEGARGEIGGGGVGGEVDGR
jgi:hypothetical protein